VKAVTGRKGIHLFALLLIAGFLCPHAVKAEPVSNAEAYQSAGKVAVLVSRRIRPYLEAVEGVTDALRPHLKGRIEVFYYNTISDFGIHVFEEQLVHDGFQLVVSVGPEASKLMADISQRINMPFVFTMMLNPEGMLPDGDSACGVTLKIAAADQLSEIKSALPNIETIGVLYDPKYNATFIEDSVQTGQQESLSVVPMPVSQKNDISHVLKKHWEDIDALWLIPDRTVISESIIQYIIKESLLRKVPVIGYNRFFFDYGAILAFILEYEAIGRQTAQIAIDFLAGRPCKIESPNFKPMPNKKIYQRLGIAYEAGGGQ